MDIEIISESEVVFTKRGRKSNTDPKMVQAFKGLKKGQVARLTSMKLDPNSDTFAKDKARVSAQIRSAMTEAGFKKSSVLWSPDGVPQVRPA
jgi:hypothetical protein